MKYGAYKKGETHIGVTKPPDRIQPCLYVMKGNIMYPLAYFTSKEKAKMFWSVFQNFMEGE